MTDADALLAAVAAAPDDDLPRLILADWLDEHGQPDRAAFVRLHVRLAGLADDHPDRAAVHGRAAELFRRHWADWVRPVLAPFGQEPRLAPPLERPSLWDRLRGRRSSDDGLKTDWNHFVVRVGPAGPGTAPAVGGVLFGRGFPDQLNLTPTADGPAATAVAAALAVAPVTALHLNLQSVEWGSPAPAADFATPALARVRRLVVLGGGIDGGPAAADLARLFGWPGWAGVTDLTLSSAVVWVGSANDDQVPAAWVRALVGSPLAGRLTALTVPHADAAFAALADYPAGGRLEELGAGFAVGEPPVTAAWERVAGRLGPRLARLRLTTSDVGDDEARALARPGWWPRVEQLWLGLGQVGDRGAAAVADDGVFPTVRTLDLGYNQVGDAGAAALAGSGLTATLRVLDLANNRLTRHGADALIAGFRDGPLARLDLRGNRFGRPAARRLRDAFGHRVRL